MKIVKSTILAVWNFFCALGEASYAANLARNGKWQKAQNLYR
jgi:hypothetical protein